MEVKKEITYDIEFWYVVKIKAHMHHEVLKVMCNLLHMTYNVEVL